MRVMGLRMALREADFGGWQGPEGDWADMVVIWLRNWNLSYFSKVLGLVEDDLLICFV
jgi:hypothetical protein